MFSSPSTILTAPLSPSRRLFISLSISLTSAHLTAWLRLSLHCNKTLVRQFMFGSPRPESSPATIASCGSWQWVAAIRHRYLRMKLHTLCFPTCSAFRRPLFCPEALTNTGPDSKTRQVGSTDHCLPLLNALHLLWASLSNREHPESKIEPRQFSDNDQGNTRP